MSKLTHDFYLIVRKSGRYYNSLKVRTTEKVPSTAAGEVAIKVSLSLPAALFTKPTLQASIVVPADRVSAPEISAEVAENIGEIVKQQTGLDLTIRVEAPQS